MTETAGTTATPVEGQADAGQNPAPAAAPQGTDEVTTLRSRLAGLDAKVTSLTQETARERATREAAEQKLRDYEAGKVSADEALRAQVEQKDAELALVRKEAALARIEAKYPETFSVLGEAAAALTPDQLAASEARFAGVPAEPETPKPLGANPVRPQAPAAKAIEDMSIEELKAHLRTFPADVMHPGID
jgi:hypothetical protein